MMELASIWIGAARTAATSSIKAKKTKLVFIVRLMGKSKDCLRDDCLDCWDLLWQMVERLSGWGERKRPNGLQSGV